MSNTQTNCPSATSVNDEPSPLTIHCCSLLDGEISDAMTTKYPDRSPTFIRETELELCCDTFPADACTAEGTTTKLNRDK